MANHLAGDGPERSGGRVAEAGDLSAPAVAPEHYDAEYYLQSCLGSAEWAASGGRTVSGMYPGILNLARLQPGEVVVDVGTGRGDLLAVAVERGAARAFGIDYSPAAVELAQKTLEVHGVADRAEVRLADGRALPLPDGIADLVCYLDVVEHLTPAELQESLRESRRVMKPGGRLIVHTMPNRFIYTVTYRVLRWLWGLGRWPADPRNQFERTMHVNELTLGELRRSLEVAGFHAEARLGSWVYTDFVPNRVARRVYSVLAKLGPLAQFGVADLFAEAHL